MFSESDLDVMQRLHDAFNPSCLLNPQKIFPLARSCRETNAAAHPAAGLTGSGGRA